MITDHAAARPEAFPRERPSADPASNPTSDPESAYPNIDAALRALREGRPLLVLDGADRENEGDVVLAAATVTDNWLAWTIRHTSGYVCAPMPAELADQLELPLMVERSQDPLRTAYTVTVDAAADVTTGISAADRAHTLRVLADPVTTPGDLIRPGHVIPLRAHDGGVLVRPGHTEAAVDLCRLAGLPPVAAIAELAREDGDMMRAPQVAELGTEHDLPVITIAELITWRQRHDRVDRMATTELPTPYGTFDVTAYRDRLTHAEHLALVPRGTGTPVQTATEDGPLVRLHSECLTGDVFSSERCDCGPQLQRALQRIAAEGGCLVYLRGHEGRGVGLTAKLQAYALQDDGLDTVDAQVALGLPIDAREYSAGAAILVDLGITRLRLMTNNPAKVAALRSLDLTVRPERHLGASGPGNQRYLETKRVRLGHDLPPDHSQTNHPETHENHQKETH